MVQILCHVRADRLGAEVARRFSGEYQERLRAGITEWRVLANGGFSNEAAKARNICQCTRTPQIHHQPRWSRADETAKVERAKMEGTDRRELSCADPERQGLYRK